MHAAFGQKAYSVFDLEQRRLVNAADPGTVDRTGLAFLIRRANSFKVLEGLLVQFDC